MKIPFLKNIHQSKIALVVIYVLTPVLAFAQVTAPIGELTWLGQVERTGLYGALLVAVAFLWKSRESDNNFWRTQIADKDKQILTMTEHITASLALQVETNRELRKIIEESTRAKEDLAHSIDIMTRGLDMKMFKEK